MRTLVDLALDNFRLKKVAYADIRFVEEESEGISTRNGVVEDLTASHSRGFGVRVLINGAWGYAASNQLSSKSVEQTIIKAIKVAQASGLILSKKVRLAPVEVIKNGRYQTPFAKDPFAIPLSVKVKLLLRADKAMKQTKKIMVAQAFYRAYRMKKIFASTEGTRTDQEILETGAGISSLAADGHEVQNRSYPNSFRGLFQTRGWELVEEADLVGEAPRVAEEAVALLTAKQCPAGRFDLILDGPQLALQVHESCGHPTELDRVLGFEASYAGTSFMELDGLGKLRYGSDKVNIVADSTAPLGLGTFGWDDEGVPAQKDYLVKNGLHVGYLTSRETAPIIGKTSNGTMRADGWENLPLIRMTNVNLEPGEWDLKELIADTREGILMSTNKAWSIDDRRINFQFGCEAGWEIKNGRKGQLLKNPSYTGITPQFWRSCDAVCNDKYWKIWGTPNCGKGEPSQVMHVSHGVSPARFRKVKTGVMKE
ncbi:MAG: TldD/PmbA family protein [Candidatus Pacebacteria bacterium]|nr:TldD/PmbA family protein [Candidatus Paceibacterota bacterium]